MSSTASMITVLHVDSAVAIPAFARQYDLQCNVCHTRPPRLNRFGEQFHMMGFQIPSAARPGGLVGSLKEDGPIKTLIDSLALRIEGGLFEYTELPRETETKCASPDEITLYEARPLLPYLSSSRRQSSRTRTERSSIFPSCRTRSRRSSSGCSRTATSVSLSSSRTR